MLAWGDRLIRADYEIGTLAASFEIDAQGRVGAIRVLRARHPAAAWLIIDSVADARISPSRLARRSELAPESFPVSLCAWWTLERRETRIPAGGCIRGFCTHMPGTSPHM